MNLKMALTYLVLEHLLKSLHVHLGVVIVKGANWLQGYSPYQILECICGFHVLVYQYQNYIFNTIFVSKHDYGIPFETQGKIFYDLHFSSQIL
jgi:hypothetical protein